MDPFAPLSGFCQCLQNSWRGGPTDNSTDGTFRRFGSAGITVSVGFGMWHKVILLQSSSQSIFCSVTYSRLFLHLG